MNQNDVMFCGSPDIFVEGDRSGAMRVVDGGIGGIGFG